jgi:hypothetical protein
LALGNFLKASWSPIEDNAFSIKSFGRENQIRQEVPFSKEKLIIKRQKQTKPTSKLWDLWVLFEVTEAS